MKRVRQDSMKPQIRRIAIYLARMFPPWIVVPVGVAQFLAVYLMLQALADLDSLRVSARAGGGALTVVLFSLLMRVFDERKDMESDRRLAHAGDPKFQNRPVVTGEVLPKDLLAIRNVAMILMVITNLLLGNSLVWIMFALMCVIGGLSSRWFFIPEARRSLMVAFVTHNPITLVVELYVVGLYVSEFGMRSLDAWSILLLMGLWLPVSAWETSRKIRIPEDETDYQTYSSVFGCRLAAMLPMVFVIVSCVCLILAGVRAGIDWTALAFIIVGAALPIMACLAFAVSPTRKRANLEPYSMCYAATSSITLVFGTLLQRGVRWN